MTLSDALNDEQWPKLLGDVAEMYSEVTLSRAYNYFKQQLVGSLIVSEGRLLRATVEGTDNYTVTMDLTKLGRSRCDCPVEGTCKHMAATLMELADRLGYPVSQLVNAKHYIKRLAAEALAKPAAGKLPDMDVEGWHRYLDQTTAGVKPGYDLGMYADMLQQQLQMMKLDSVPMSDTDSVYFDLHRKLFILRKIKQLLAQGGGSYFASSAIHRIRGDILGWFRQRSGTFPPPSVDERLRQTLHYVRKQMAGEPGNRYEEFRVYAALWLYEAVPGKEVGQWAEQELDALEAIAGDSPAVQLTAAKSFLYVQLSQSGAAWEALKAKQLMKDAPAELLFPFLEYFGSREKWPELVEWLEQSADFIYGKAGNDFETYMNYWRAAAQHYPLAEGAMWEALERLLPQSMPIIAELMYEQGKWKQWIELQLLLDRDPFTHRAAVLQPIEKEMPEALLPYYHQAAERYVSLKNRHDYKAAVKLLKRLQKLYKKMKQPERWDRYFHRFTEKHSRLRALQEELRKGKLLE